MEEEHAGIILCPFAGRSDPGGYSVGQLSQSAWCVTNVMSVPVVMLQPTRCVVGVMPVVRSWQLGHGVGMGVALCMPWEVCHAGCMGVRLCVMCAQGVNDATYYLGLASVCITCIDWS